GVSGRYVPANGAMPATMEVGSSSSKAVLLKLLPLPPRRLTSSTLAPPGDGSVMFRSLSRVCRILIRTFRSALVGAWLIVIVDVVVPLSRMAVDVLFANVWTLGTTVKPAL